MVAQQVETAQLFPGEAADTLTGQLVCYGRSVTEDEWNRMRANTIGDSINPWGVAQFRTIEAVEPETAAEESAYDQWLAQTSEREAARLDRIHGAVGVIPVTIWIALFFIAGVIFLFMLFFADPAERAVTQVLLMGAVTSVIAILFLLLAALDNPFRGGVGGLEPVAMERTLNIVEEALDAVGRDVPIPCDETGTQV